MAKRKTAVKALTNKTCKQITDLVFNYLNDNLAPTVKRDFQRHLRICPDCVSFLKTYKKTVTVTRSLREEDIPAKVRNNLLDFLRRRIRRQQASL
jgi:hypothetical protein